MFFFWPLPQIKSRRLEWVPFIPDDMKIRIHQTSQQCWIHLIFVLHMHMSWKMGRWCLQDVGISFDSVKISGSHHITHAIIKEFLLSNIYCKLKENSWGLQSIAKEDIS